MQSSRILNALTLTLTLLAASNSFAGNAAQLLSQDLQVGIKSLPRETRMYHYFNLSNTSGLKKSKDRYSLVQNHLSRTASSFWDLKNNTTKLANAGLGLYLAVDPYASSPAAAQYSGANFGSYMMEVTFNPGTRYLDLLDDVKLRPETIQAIMTETGMSQQDAGSMLLPRTEKYGKKSHSGFGRDTLQVMAEPQNKAFRQMVQNVFTQNGIVLTEYGWQSSVSAFCGMPTKQTRIHHSALVYVGGQSSQNTVRSVTLVVMNQNMPQLDNQELEALERNRKLYSALAPVKPLEISFQNEKNKATRAVIYSNIKSTVDMVYPNPSEADAIRMKTFDCMN